MGTSICSFIQNKLKGEMERKRHICYPIINRIRREQRGGRKMKKILIGIISVFITATLLVCCLGDDETELDTYNEETTADETVTENEGVNESEETVSEHTLIERRPYYTKLLGDGADTVTVMIYMIGSNLESGGGGCATDDLEEIAAATADSKVKIVIETGGTTDWVNPAILGGTTQRFIMEDGKLEEVEDLGQLCMTDEKTLGDFISWATEKYASNRNMLLFWDHGGGTVMGFGSDEYYEDGSLELSDIARALKRTGVKFDLIGFDACLMGTIETAYALEPYADYLIASEELEPGTGWYYTDWITKLAEDTSINTTDLGQKIIDDYVASNDGFFFSQDCTLALIDLGGIKGAYNALCSYMTSSISALKQNQFKTLSRARANTRSYGEGGYEQIDIIDYIEKADIGNGEELKAALEDVILYNGTNIEGANGLAMYYPYDCPEYYNMMLSELKAIEYGDSCTDFFSYFLSMLTGAQAVNRSTLSPIEKMTGYEPEENETDYSAYDWYDSSYYESYGEDSECCDLSEKEIIDKGDYFALQLSEAEWEDINYIEMQVFLDDGEGYIDLGSDNVYEFDDDGDLKIDFDYYWVALNGQIMPFYAEEEYEDESKWYTYGYIPAVLIREGKEQDIDIMVYWGNDCENGKVMGYRIRTEGMSVAEKGYRDFLESDTICAVCDYYTYEGEYDASYYFGERINVGDGLAVSYEFIEEQGENYGACIWCKLQDVYNNEFYTESVIYE